LNNDQTVITDTAKDLLSTFLKIKKSDLADKIEVIKKIEGPIIINGQHINFRTSNNLKFNIFGEKYFKDLFDKACTLVLSEGDFKMMHVGLSLMLYLARISPKTILNKIFNGDIGEFLESIYY
jgi:hypothetical protein